MRKSGSDPTLLLDECLSYRIAEMLFEVGCSFTSVRKEQLEGVQDEELVQWMGKRGMVWVTNDHSARVKHERAIVNERISVVWVRGIQHGKSKTARNILSNKVLLHLLVAKVDDIAQAVIDAEQPLYFLLQLYGSIPRLMQYENIQDVGKRKRSR